MSTGRRGLLTIYVRRVRSQSAAATLRKLVDPAAVARFAHRVAVGRLGDATNPYLPSASRQAEIAFVAKLLDEPLPTVERVCTELETDSHFLDELNRAYQRHRGRPLVVGRFRIHHAITRLRTPALVIETGVHDGLSSAVVLRAMERNGIGRLVSIDLPATDLPPGVEGPGWLVPADLRSRWELLLGDARRLLPKVLDGSDDLGVFIHDSDHSSAHMEFELRAARSAMPAGGLLVSDQDYPFDPLIDQLAAEWGARHLRVRTGAGEPGTYLGAVVW